MCTVIYQPLANKVVFSSNRDEDPNRKQAAPPALYQQNGLELLYPADGLAGGTWIGLNNSGIFVVMLNGGFVNHYKATNYRISRGVLIRNMLQTTNPASYWMEENLDNIEPFTSIVYANQMLYELIWTGVEKHVSNPEINKAHIWSSATLYNQQAMQNRRTWFHNYLSAQEEYNNNNLLRFLQYPHQCDRLDTFVMNRNEKVKTCSISIVTIEAASASFNYYDLLNGSSCNSEIFFNKKSPSASHLVHKQAAASI